jgi:hypothetical protein
MVKFYCCEEFKRNYLDPFDKPEDLNEHLEYIKENFGIVLKYCSFCGQRLSFNIPIIRSKQAD